MSNQDRKFVTPNGKEIIIEPVRETSLVQIRFKEGGERPEEFDGLYTNRELAYPVIEKYLAKLSAPKKPVGRPKTKPVEAEEDVFSDEAA